MRSLIHFIKYNNAFPVILAVVLLGTGAAFAASPKLREAVLSENNSAPQPFVTPKVADPTRLLQENIDTYSISVRIDNIIETKETFTVEYSYNTYDIVNGAWQETRKNRRMDVSKTLLGKQKITEYLFEQIGQIVHQELAYLNEVKKKATGNDGDKQRISKYAGLVGKDFAVGNGKSSVETSVIQENKKTPDSIEEDKNDDVATQTTVGISDEKLREMIVQAVADFLAIDTAMPEVTQTTESVLETTVPKPSSEFEETEVSMKEQPEENTMETEQ